MKRWFGAALWVIALIICLAGLDHAMRRGDGAAKYSAFLSGEGEYDVFLLGTSHMMDAVYPPLLWRDYGITSYNLGNAAETMEATYWTLRLALTRHTPKAVLVDVCYIDRAQADVSNYAMNHLFLDELPLSAEKLRAIWSLFPEGSRAQFVFPLVAYHTRWEELLAGTNEGMVDAAMPFMYGAELRAGRSEPALFERTQEMDTTETPGKQALRELISLCLERRIDVVLTAIPYPAEPERQRMMNSAQAIAQEMGVPFVNLFDVDGLVDFETDCYDAMSHLNPDGAQKVTAYLGAYLAQHLPLKDKRGDAGHAGWDAALEEYESVYGEIWAAQSRLNGSM